MHVRALQHLLEGKDSLALNVGTGSGSSVREVITAVEKVSGLKVPARESARRAGDPPELVSDPGAAYKALGWQARYSDLHTIVDSAVRWHRRHG